MRAWLARCGPPAVDQPQSTGQFLAFSPLQTPSPQQLLEQLLPVQRQSAGQVWQSSPLPSQMPLPQLEVPQLLMSAGQLADEPEQYSAGSQVSVEARQRVLLPRKPSAGQVVNPSQVSATSQIPATARQTVEAGAAVWLQVPVWVLQVSVVQGLLSSHSALVVQVVTL